MSQQFNYRHLYYFWVVAHEGSLTRAADRLDMAVQTISAQVRELEKQLGHALLKPQGRRLVLTEAGDAALSEADRIFAIGENLPHVVGEAAGGHSQRLAVGISDGVPKLVVHRLLQPTLSAPNLRLLCHEGEYDQLWAELALHKLDVVLSDRPAPTSAALPLRSQLLAMPHLAWYGSAALVDALQGPFPQCLANQPVLLPTSHASVRAQIDHWLQEHRIRVRVVGECEDTALLTTLGAAGLGLFPASVWLDHYLVNQLGLKRLAESESICQEFHLIYTPRKVMHPLIELLVAQAQEAMQSPTN